MNNQNRKSFIKSIIISGLAVIGINPRDDSGSECIRVRSGINPLPIPEGKCTGWVRNLYVRYACPSCGGEQIGVGEMLVKCECGKEYIAPHAVRQWVRVKGASAAIELMPDMTAARYEKIKNDHGAIRFKRDHEGEFEQISKDDIRWLDAEYEATEIAISKRPIT